MSCRAHGPRYGLTLLELLVALAIILVLTSLIWVISAKMVKSARQTACLNNLRQIGLAATGFAMDNDGLLPAEGNLESRGGSADPDLSPAWFHRLPRYLESRGVKEPVTVFQCPLFDWPGPKSFRNAVPKSYKMNAYLDDPPRPNQFRLGDGKDPGNTVLFIDALAGETGMGQWGHCPYSAVDEKRHGGRANVLFLDLHVGTVERKPHENWKDIVRWRPW